MSGGGPRRIVCLSEETAETLYLLGAEDRIAAVTGYAVRPPRIRREKPRVGAFQTADVAGIRALRPDLVLLYSDVQAALAAELARAGLEVHLFNQRDIAGILRMIRTLGALVDAADRAGALAEALAARVAAVAARQAAGWRVPTYLEEWDAPMITGIGWVSELLAAAGGRDVFAARAGAARARDRMVADAEVIAARPELIIASWCGRKVRPERIAARPGWQAVPAVAAGRIVEVKSPLLLAPGPAALTDGLDALVAAIEAARAAVPAGG